MDPKENIDACERLIGIPLGDDIKELRTDTDRWDPTRLGLLNAVLDTMLPGTRLYIEVTDGGRGEPNGKMYFGKVPGVGFTSERNLAKALRALADSIDPPEQYSGIRPVVQ